MRRAHRLRLPAPRGPSSRDVCVFCASRQIRHLNSSTKAPQNAQIQLPAQENAPARPMSQAARARQALAASAAASAPPPTQSPHLSQAQRMRASLGAYEPPRFQPPPHRQSSPRGNNYNSSESRQPFGRRSDYAQPESHQPQRDRYRVNMHPKPQVDMPSFGSEQLRRRNQSQQASERAHTHQPARPAPRRTMLNQDEISKLLGNDTPRSPTRKTYQPLATNTNSRFTCWHCGSRDHMAAACPDKPTIRHTQAVSRQPISDQSASSRYGFRRSNVDQNLANLEIEPQLRNSEEPEADKRRSRFEMDNEAPVETRNRYEEPERRRGGGTKNSRRVMRGFEEDEDMDSRISQKERKRLRKEAKKAAQMEKAEPTPVTLPEFISVANLASLLKLRVEDFVAKLEELGFEDVQNSHVLNSEHAGLIAQEYNFEPTFVGEQEDGDLYPPQEITPEEYAALPARPPVVTIMGHVDHGKTTILDYMRSTSVAATEFGGITQHIGAFSVPLANGKKITFLDTPGHSAFETMRARGANVTDIVVLVVAADDSVMPQTVEAIKHAQAARVPIIVAINKIDKQQADPDSVKLDLGRHGIEIEDFGGDVQAICVSGKTGQGIPELEEAISTLSELLDHRADPKAEVQGWVLEGTTKKSGRVATVLVRNGTLRRGTALVAGTTWTRVRSLRNEAGVVVDEVGPGIAVEVDGWRDQPIAGDEVLQALNEHQATAVSELRIEKLEKEQMARDMEAINESRRLEAERREAEEAIANGEEGDAAKIKESGPEVISFIIKGDVSGSVEAVIDSVSAIGNGEVSTRVLRHGVGAPSEFDIQHAADAQGHIINFNTNIPANITQMAERMGVKIIDNNIIYRVVEDIKELLSEKLAPTIIQKVTGEADIAAIFEIGLHGRKTMKVAGSKVRNGAVDRGSKARVLRNDQIIHEGTIENLKNQKKDVDSMRKDTECGITFADWADFQVGDKIQCYDEKHEKRHL